VRATYFQKLTVTPVAPEVSLGPIEYRWEPVIPHPSSPTLEPNKLPIKWVPSLSPRVKWPGRDVDHTPLSSAEVKERIELHLFSPSVPT
jgi:hypothetical protein